MTSETTGGDIDPYNLSADLEAEIQTELEQQTQLIEAELEDIQRVLTPRVQRLRGQTPDPDSQSSSSTSTHLLRFANSRQSKTAVL